MQLRGARWSQITLAKKSIKEAAKKHFTSNYIAQIIPDMRARVFVPATDLQYKDGELWLALWTFF